MDKPTTNNRPTHQIFHVVGEGKQARWTEIGVGWSHSKGDGLNVQLNFQPLNPGRLVILPAKAKDATKQEDAA